MVNASTTVKQGTCRIFFTPKVDERGQTLRLRDQRALAIEMDKFLVTRKCMGVFLELKIFSLIFICFLVFCGKTLVHPGENEVRRRSDESSVTIPYDRSFRRIGSQDRPQGSTALSQFQFW